MIPVVPIAGVFEAFVVALALALVYWTGFCFRSPSWTKTVIKTGSVLALVLAAWLAGGPGALIVALLFCAAGDYFLSRPSERQFMAGIGAFAAGHIAYVWLFLTHRMADTGVLTGLPHVAVIAILALFGLFMAAVLWSRAGVMRVPVMIYIPVILSMGVAALALPSLEALALVHVAAGMFILSDFVLAMEMFVVPAGHRLHRYTPFVVWPFYWGAQALFFLGFAGIALT